MASENLDGAVVSFEYLDSKKKWCWSVGQITHSDDHVCTVKEWSSTPVDETLTTRVELEVAAAKEEARKCQERLLCIRQQMDEQATGASRADRERTSHDLSGCLAESGKHRRHYRSLEEDLGRIGAASHAQLKAKAFIPSTNTINILRSSVLKEALQYSASFVFLSSEECGAIENLAAQHRSQVVKELAEVNATVDEAVSKFSEMQEQIHGLENKVKQLDSSPVGVRGSHQSEEVAELQDKIKELEAYDSRCKWDDNAPLVLTNHSYDFPWDDGKPLLHHKPEETKAVVTAEVAFACRVPLYCVTVTALKAGDRSLHVEFSVNHPLGVSLKRIDECVANYSFPSLQYLHQNPLGAKVGLDRAIEEIERALGVPEGKHEGLYFSEFVESMPDMSFSNDRDAYESEIGDLLMLLDKLNNENRSLQYTLDKATAEQKKQVCAAQKDQEALNNETARLRDIISKLKDLADQQERELEENRLRRQRAEQARFRRNLQPLAENAGSPEYAITMDEYIRQREAADEAQEAFEHEKTKADEMLERLKQYEEESVQRAEQMRDLEDALAAKDEATADSFNAMESEMLDIIMQLKASEGCCTALQALNIAQAAELKAFRKRHNASLLARQHYGGLEIHEPSLAPDIAENTSTNPALIAHKPLYSITIEEHNTLKNRLHELDHQTSDLKGQLTSQQQHIDTLQTELHDAKIEETIKAEIAAFRQKRQDAKDARADEPELAAADGMPPRSARASSHGRPTQQVDPAKQAVDPAVIAEEPLYAVTLDEFKGKLGALAQAEEAAARLADELEKERAGAEKLAGEAEKLAGEAERLAAELADRDAEVVAFRVKRNAALATRCGVMTLVSHGNPLPSGIAAGVSVEPSVIAEEPLYCVTLEELLPLLEVNAAMMHEVEVLGDRLREALGCDAADVAASDSLLAQLEKLLSEVECAREREAGAREGIEDKESEWAQLRGLLGAENERMRRDLDDARAEVERVQGELDLLTDKLDEAWKLYGDADAVSAAGVTKMIALADLVSAARDSEENALAELEAKENELARLREALEDTRGRDEIVDALNDEVAQLQKEKEIVETELVNAQKELNDAEQELRAAEDKTAEKEREVESMTLDLDALNSRIQDLLEELEDKTEQYNQVIKELDEFAKNQNREDEKELLQRLAAREQELFELQEARRGENEEHEKQINVLQDQINRLRDQTDKDNTLHDGMQDEMARLRKALADAEEAVRMKDAEILAQREDMEGMIDEHEAQMREMEAELEDKSKEVSDALERLEEMSAMLQEAREGEESALRLRADSDAEVFRLQKELDKLKQLQNAMDESGGDKEGLLAQVMDAEAQLRDTEAALRQKDAEFDNAERSWRNKVSNLEDLNRDLRRVLKRTMAALSKSKDTMGNSADALDSFRDELQPMMQ